MKAKVLGINEVHVTRFPVVYTCYGLGSCIGLFVVDRAKKISGGAHIPLASRLDAGEFKDAISLIDQLLISFSKEGSSLMSLKAKITGGANLFDSTMSIGEENARTVFQSLVERKIFVASADVGGKFSRTARFNSTTHELQITTSEKRFYTI